MTEWKLDTKLEKLLNDFEAEQKKEGTLDEPFVGCGDEEYSARRIIDEVRKGTPFGRDYAANWKELEERKNKKPYSNDETEIGGES